MNALRLLFATVVCLAFGCWGGAKDTPRSSGPQAPNSPADQGQPLLKATENEFESEFRKNLIDANLKYQDKEVELSEVWLASISKDSQGYFAGLCDSCRYVEAPPGRTSGTYKPSIIVRIAPGAIKDFAERVEAQKSTKNRVTTLRGVCKGSQHDPSARPDYYILIEDAVVVSTVGGP